MIVTYYRILTSDTLGVIKLELKWNCYLVLYELQAKFTTLVEFAIICFCKVAMSGNIAVQNFYLLHCD